MWVETAQLGRSVPLARPLQRLVIVGTFAALPLTYIGIFPILGTNLGGLSWVLIGLLAFLALCQIPGLRVGDMESRFLLGFIALGAVTVALSGATEAGLRSMAQFSAFALVFLVANNQGPDPQARRLVMPIAWVSLIIGAALGFGSTVSVTLFNMMEPRSLVITLTILFIVVTLDDQRVATVLTAGAFALLPSVVTTSRTATIVILGLIFYRLSQKASLRVKVLSGLVGIIALAVVFSTPEFQQRTFFGGSGSPIDIITRSGDLNSMGRFVIWPIIFDRCVETPFFGSGLGSVSATMADIAQTHFAHPHNEFLRLFCDTGIFGLTLFWAFVGAVVLRGRPREVSDSDHVALYHAALLVALSMFAFSLTDNVLVYTSIFMLPAAVILGWFARSKRLQTLRPPRGSVRR